MKNAGSYLLLMKVTGKVKVIRIQNTQTSSKYQDNKRMIGLAENENNQCFTLREREMCGKCILLPVIESHYHSLVGWETRTWKSGYILCSS